MMTVLGRYGRVLLISGCSLVASSVAQASGFQLFEYNGRDVGNYGAGGAAIAEDASTNFTNPAGLTRLGQQVVMGGDIVHVSTRFKGRACGGADGACILSPSNEEGGKTKFIPSLYYAHPLNSTWSLGLGIGVNAPFGLATTYGDGDDPVRYTATKSEIVTMNINPNVAMQINPWWSVGVGVNALRLEATLDQDVNLDPGAPFHLKDTRAHNKAADWGYGWNAGVLFTPSDNTRLGVSYRSIIALHLTGDSKFTGGSLQSRESDLSADLTLPDMWMFSGWHAFNPQWSVMGTVTHTGWNSVQHLRLVNTVVPSGIATGTTTGTVTFPESFRNTWRFALGADYQVNPMWRLRVGTGYDQTPVNNKDRTVRLPDGSRFTLAAGFKYTPNPFVDIDFGYQHLFIGDQDIRTIQPINQSIGNATDNSADVAGLQITWNVDAKPA